MKFSQRRRGISYIMEVVMMTLVITALASVVLTWGLSMISSSRVSLTGSVDARMNRLQEGLVVEDVQMLTASSMRVYVRNVGSIQIVIDEVYVNNIITPVQGVCPSGSLQAGTASVTAGATSLAVSLPTSEPNTSYLVTVATGWSTTTSITGKAVTGFTINFGTAAPGGGSTVSWNTNYATCPSGTKLSLSMQAAGAVDISVPSSVSSCVGGPVCPRNTYTVIAATNRGTTFQGSFTV